MSSDNPEESLEVVGSDSVAARIKVIMGDEPLLSFARRAGVGQTTLRKYLAGSMPSTDRLVAMADAGNVSVAWLAAGRGPIRISAKATPPTRTLEKGPDWAFVARLNRIIGTESNSSFGRRCGIGEATLRCYLEGQDPSRRRLIALADAAGVSVEWLATGRGEMRAVPAVEEQADVSRSLEG